MKNGILLAATVTLLTSGACTSLPMFGSQPHPECRSQSHIIYYNYQEDDLRASADPIIELIAGEVEACRLAGGELESVSITGFPNRAENSASGDATAVARGQAVLAALVAAGLPSDKIQLSDYREGAEDINQSMRRRAEIAVRMR